MADPAVPVLSPAELADIEARMKANEGLVVALDARLCRVTAAKRPRTIRACTECDAVEHFETLSAEEASDE